MAIIYDKEPVKLTPLAEIKRIIQNTMKVKGISATEARKSLGVKRYEKSLFFIT